MIQTDHEGLQRFHCHHWTSGYRSVLACLMCPWHRAELCQGTLAWPWGSSSPGQNWGWLRDRTLQRGNFRQSTSSDPKTHPEEPDHPGFPCTSRKVFVSLVPSKLLVQLSLRVCRVFEGIGPLIVWKQRFNHKSCQALPLLSFISQTECPRVMYSSNGYWFKLWAFYKIRNYYLLFK